MNRSRIIIVLDIPVEHGHKKGWKPWFKREELPIKVQKNMRKRGDLKRSHLGDSDNFFFLNPH